MYPPTIRTRTSAALKVQCRTRTGPAIEIAAMPLNGITRQVRSEFFVWFAEQRNAHPDSARPSGMAGGPEGSVEP